jgi:hypothetical protein
MPVYHLLEQILNEYIKAAGRQSRQPLFQSVSTERLAASYVPAANKIYLIPVSSTRAVSKRRPS